jgi:hypothetical protein
MNKLSTETIKAFIAGALVVCGFRSLIGLRYLSIGNITFHDFIYELIYFLALPLGICLFLNMTGVLRWTWIYLLLVPAVAVFRLFLSIHYHITSLNHPPIFWSVCFDLPIPIVLFGLLSWSHSNRFKNEQDV